MRMLCGTVLPIKSAMFFSPKAASSAGWSAKLMWRALNSAGLNKSLKFMVFPLVLLSVALLLDWVVEAV